MFLPNHKYRTVTTTSAATDNVGRQPDGRARVGDVATSPTTRRAARDGNTTNDVVVLNDTTFRLRAERDENGSGRVYTLTYRATDACGNSVEASATVSVPLR